MKNVRQITACLLLISASLLIVPAETALPDNSKLKLSKTYQQLQTLKNKLPEYENSRDFYGDAIVRVYNFERSHNEYISSLPQSVIEVEAVRAENLAIRNSINQAKELLELLIDANNLKSIYGQLNWDEQTSKESEVYLTKTKMALEKAQNLLQKWGYDTSQVKELDDSPLRDGTLLYLQQRGKDWELKHKELEELIKNNWQEDLGLNNPENLDNPMVFLLIAIGLILLLTVVGYILYKKKLILLTTNTPGESTGAMRSLKETAIALKDEQQSIKSILEDIQSKFNQTVEDLANLATNLEANKNPSAPTVDSEKVIVDNLNFQFTALSSKLDDLVNKITSQEHESINQFNLSKNSNSSPSPFSQIIQAVEQLQSRDGELKQLNERLANNNQELEANMASLEREKLEVDKTNEAVSEKLEELRKEQQQQAKADKQEIQKLKKIIEGNSISLAYKSEMEEILLLEKVVSLFNQEPSLILSNVASYDEVSYHKQSLNNNQYLVFEKPITGKGDFWIVELGDSNSRDSYLFPKERSIRQSQVRMAKALFKGYQLENRSFILVKPARVSRMGGSEKWQLEEPGELKQEQS